MDEVFKIYSLTPGESLSDLASKFEMSEEDLMAFHNKHSAAAGLMWFHNFVGITKIAVPTFFKSNAERQREHQKYFPKPHFFKDFLAKEYRISEKYHGQMGDFEISWNLKIEILKKDSHYQVAFRTRNFKHSGNREDDKISGLARACMESIEPLCFHVDREGAVTSLVEPGVYTTRFEAKREDLQGFFVGEISDAYIQKFSEQLRDPLMIFRGYQQLPWMALLFPGMQTFHRKNPWTAAYSVYPNSFPLRMNCSADYQHEMLESAHTSVKCIPADPVDLLEILMGRKFDGYGAENTQVHLELMWNTDKETHQLQSAGYTATFYWEDEEYSARQCHVNAL